MGLPVFIPVSVLGMRQETRGISSHRGGLNYQAMISSDRPTVDRRASFTNLASPFAKWVRLWEACDGKMGAHPLRVLLLPTPTLHRFLKVPRVLTMVDNPKPHKGGTLSSPHSI